MEEFMSEKNDVIGRIKEKYDSMSKQLTSYPSVQISTAGKDTTMFHKAL